VGALQAEAKSIEGPSKTGGSSNTSSIVNINLDKPEVNGKYTSSQILGCLTTMTPTGFPRLVGVAAFRAMMLTRITFRCNRRSNMMKKETYDLWNAKSMKLIHKNLVLLQIPP
jgi:hypothetical protein